MLPRCIDRYPGRVPTEPDSQEEPAHVNSLSSPVLGLDCGVIDVPANFDDPLPEDLLAEFEK